MNNKDLYQKEIEKTLIALQNGHTILYPTDTVWGIGCDATNSHAVKKVFKIKQRAAAKSLLLLVDSVTMLQQIITNIPEKALEIIDTATQPTSIIYSNPKGLAKNVVATDNTVGIRVVKDKFCKTLIHKLGKPIVSTSANSSGKPTPKNFKAIREEILNTVDYIVNLQPDKTNIKSSQIIKINADGSLENLRE